MNKEIILEKINQFTCDILKDESGEYWARSPFLEKDINLGSQVNLDDISKMRYYQINQVRLHLEAFLKGKMRHACVMPTGAGKTMTARFIMTWQKIRDFLGVANGSDLRVLYVGGHRLLKQAIDTFEGIENLQLTTTTPGKTIDDRLQFDLVIYDEGHHEAMETWQNNLPHVSNKPIIYLTATPDRADKMMMKIQEEVKAIDRKTLEDQGLLAKMRVYSIMDSNLTSKERTVLIKEYVLKFKNELDKTLITVRTHFEAKALFRMLLDEDPTLRMGLCVDVTPQEVNQIISRLENDEIDFIINCNKLNEGVDIKGLTDVILGRQFGSAAELNQNVGRGIRPKTKGENIGKIHQFINPLKKSLDASKDVGGVPESHWLREFSHGNWREGQMA